MGDEDLAAPFPFSVGASVMMPLFRFRPKPALAIGRAFCDSLARSGCGVVAQLVERLVRNEKVRGSSPLGSTIQTRAFPHFPGPYARSGNRRS